MKSSKTSRNNVSPGPTFLGNGQSLYLSQVGGVIFLNQILQHCSNAVELISEYYVF